METTNDEDDLLAIVDAAYTAYLGGDIEGAIEHCADDAMWHAVTPVPDAQWNGSHPIRRYWEEIVPGAVAQMPGYQFGEMVRHVHPPLVVTHVRNDHGSGLMVFRVVGGKITDAWALNADGRDAGGYF